MRQAKLGLSLIAVGRHRGPRPRDAHKAEARNLGKSLKGVRMDILKILWQELDLKSLMTPFRELRCILIVWKCGNAHK